MLGVVVVALVLAGCGGPSSDEQDRDSAIYAAMIRWFVTTHPPAAMQDPDDLPTVYIEPLGADEVPIEIQVEVIDLLADFVVVRFTDEREESVEESVDGQPVHDGSILIGLAPIPTGEAVAVRGEVYRSADEISGYLVTVEHLGSGRCGVTGTPIDVPVEGLAPVAD